MENPLLHQRAPVGSETRHERRVSNATGCPAQPAFFSPATFRPRPSGAANAAELDRLADHQLAHGRIVQAERLAEMAAELRGAA
jgi:hypothetical protein